MYLYLVRRWWNYLKNVKLSWAIQKQCEIFAEYYSKLAMVLLCQIVFDSIWVACIVFMVDNYAHFYIFHLHLWIHITNPNVNLSDLSIECIHFVANVSFNVADFFSFSIDAFNTFRLNHFCDSFLIWTLEYLLPSKYAFSDYYFRYKNILQFSEPVKNWIKL